MLLQGRTLRHDSASAVKSEAGNHWGRFYCLLEEDARVADKGTRRGRRTEAAHHRGKRHVLIERHGASLGRLTEPLKVPAQLC